MAKSSKPPTGRPIKIHLHSVVDILHDLHQQGHLEPFREAAEKAGAVLSVHPQTIDFVKDYMTDNDLQAKSSIARDVVNACPPGTPPGKCPFRA